MGAKIVPVLIVGMAMSHLSVADVSNRVDYSAVQYFKNYALSTCIADGYSSSETVSDASAAARGYLEFGSFALEAHTDATLLGRKFLKREYKSMSGEPLILMKCIDFYHSKELDALARKYQKMK